jgi:hypothetical protein
MAKRPRANIKTILLAFGAGLIVAVTSYESAKGDLAGVLAGDTISKAMGQAQAMLAEARQTALAIEAQTNEDVTERLNQVQQIATETLGKLEDLEAKTFSDVNQLTSRIDGILDDHQRKLAALEDKFMRDLSLRIREVECTAERIINGSMKDALGKFGELLGTNKIRITPPILYADESVSCGLFQRCRVTQTFDIRTPFTETYGEIKTYLEARMGKIQEETPINSIIDTYDFIGYLAKRTTCFTNSNNRFYEREFVIYSNKVRAWSTIRDTRGQK